MEAHPENRKSGLPDFPDFKCRRRASLSSLDLLAEVRRPSGGWLGGKEGGRDAVVETCPKSKYFELIFEPIFKLFFGLLNQDGNFTTGDAPF